MLKTLKTSQKSISTQKLSKLIGGNVGIDILPIGNGNDPFNPFNNIPPIQHPGTPSGDNPFNTQTGN